MEGDNRLRAACCRHDINLIELVVAAKQFYYPFRPIGQRRMQPSYEDGRLLSYHG